MVQFNGFVRSKQPMTLAELMGLIQDICPDVIFDEGGEGEVIAYLGVAIHPDDSWHKGSMPVSSIHN